MTKLKVAVCECPPELVAGSAEWRALCATVSRESPDLLLLNEMPFGRWIAAGTRFDETVWRASCRDHDTGLRHLDELGAAVVAGTRPRRRGERRVNEAFLWTRKGGPRAVHTKQCFPEEEGYYETRWFEPGARHFRLAGAGSLRTGFLICTELMFNEHARHYGRRGAHVILVPRAVGSATLDRWLVAARMAAIVSGAFVLSSNRTGTDARGQTFGGAGWIIDPHGDLVAHTSPAAPLACHVLDPRAAVAAKRRYPCYVKEWVADSCRRPPNHV